MSKTRRLSFLVPLVLTACVEGFDNPHPRSGDPDPIGGDPIPGTCPRTPPAADRTRYVVVSHPYDNDANYVGVYEVLELSATGDLTTTGKTFELGPATDGQIQFTPDGKIGLVAHHGNSGTLGVFSLAADGTPTVIHQEYDGDNHDLWVSGVTMHPDGDRALIIDGNWQNNGGGIYEVAIACDGTLTENGLLIESKLADSIHFLPTNPDRMVVVAKEIGPESAPVSGISDDVHVIDISGTATWLAGADLFPGDDHVVVASALTSDGRYVLVADGSSFSGLPHRMGAAEILSNDMVFAQTISPLPFSNPGGLSASPYNNAILLVTWGGSDDAATWFAFNPDSASPVGTPTEVTYTNGGVKLPGAAAVITRGGLTGRILLSENVKARQMQFLQAGGVADVDALSFFDDTLPEDVSQLDAIVGAIGVQP